MIDIDVQDKKIQTLADFAAKLNTILAPYGAAVRIRETYKDLGAGMKWHTLIVYDLRGRHWQALTPNQYNDVMDGRNLDKIIDAVVEHVKEFNAMGIKMAMAQMERMETI